MRKLAAIMFTDIVGYTALMGENEAKALQLLQHNRELLKPLIEKFRGEWLKEMGDGTLSSFASAVDAVICALEIQRSLKTEHDLTLRIGIHIGDVVFEESDVFGDGVNVASRIEPLAPPGGICVSERVYDDIRNQPGITVVSLGKRKLKNVRRPIEVFALTGNDLPSPDVRRRFLQRPVVRRAFLPVGTVLVLGLIYLLVLQERLHHYGGVPSIGVLYLENLGAEGDDYFSYGITEDIIVDLSKAGLIRVPSMKDILSFKEKAMTLSEIAAALRVRFILTGSLRREPDHFRLAAQLIEPESGRNIWSNRWEEPLTEITSVKGKIIHEIINALGIKPTAVTAQEIETKATLIADAYEFYLKAKYNYDHRNNLEDVAVARGLLKRAIELDDEFVAPRLYLAYSYSDQGDYAQALEIYQEAITVTEKKGIINEKATAMRGIGAIHFYRGEYDEALNLWTHSLDIHKEAGDQAGEATILKNVGAIYYMLGKYDQALEFFSRSLELAEKLGDRDEAGSSLHNIGALNFRIGRYSQALAYWKRSYAIFQELGDHALESMSLNNIGLIHSLNGEYDDALECYISALTLSQQLGDQAGEASCLNHLGDTYYRLEDYTLAAEHFGRSKNIYEEIKAGADILEPLSYLALCKAKLGDMGAASELVQLLVSKFNTVEVDAINPLTLWNTSQVYDLVGHQEEAARYLADGYTSVNSQAEKLQSTEARESFLTKVTENREIISAWKQQD
ncbi:MAG: tetratricopeptide repeat protein [Candidatus Neomarinimicrobiota bacterium]